MAAHPAIKVIGFDLDQTLYPKSPEIDAAIQEYIYEKIAAHKNCSIEEAKMQFLSYYPGLSGRKTFLKLGIPNAEETVQEALECGGIARFLKPDPIVRSLLENIKKKYGSLSLLTGSDKKIMDKKLLALNVPITLFDCILSGETSKSDGTAYKHWMNFFMEKDSSLKQENFLYIGDRCPIDVDMPVSLGIQVWLVNIAKNNPACSVPQFKSLLDLRKELL
ncbi:MAG: HAD family hydrolase [Candidatus Diapherotrites archaeon]|nr:HAD family hydrolase [Candidatus Diapherotrites archaeon]